MYFEVLTEKTRTWIRAISIMKNHEYKIFKGPLQDSHDHFTSSGHYGAQTRASVYTGSHAEAT